MGRHARARVLVADDAPEIARRVVELLESVDVEVIGPAQDGAEALALFRAERPSCAILDLHMPKLNGLEVLRAIRQEDSHCQVIILCAHLEPAQAEACLDSGANHCLEKAAEVDRLVEIVQALAQAR